MSYNTDLDLPSSLCGIYHQKRLSTWAQRGKHPGIGLMNYLFNFLCLEKFFSWQKIGTVQRNSALNEIQCKWPGYKSLLNLIEPCVVLCWKESKTVMALIQQKFWLLLISFLNVPTFLLLCSDSTSFFTQHLFQHQLVFICWFSNIYLHLKSEVLPVLKFASLS